MNESKTIKKLSAENERLRKRCKDLEYVICRMCEMDFGTPPDNLESLINNYLTDWDAVYKEMGLR